MNALAKTELGIVKFSGFKEAFECASAFARSSLVPSSFKGKPQDIVVAWQCGSEIGLSPMQSLRSIAVINGRATLWGDALIAIASSHPDFEDIKEETLEQIRKNGRAVCRVKRKGRNWDERSFSIEDAKKAKLWGKAGPWQSYPERMLQLRARGFAIRDVFADALFGMTTAEEARDYEAEKESPPPEIVGGSVVDLRFEEVEKSTEPEYTIENLIDEISQCETTDDLHELVNTKGQAFSAEEKKKAGPAFAERLRFLADKEDSQIAAG